jgi:HEAT repeat protein
LINTLQDTAIGLTIVTALTVVLLAIRRVWLARVDRRRREQSVVLRPAVMKILDGGDPPTGLSSPDSALLVDLLGRYALQLRGESSARITRYFEERGDVDAEIARLRKRRAWRRATSAHRLGDMGSAKAIEPLLERLTEDGDRAVRAAAARSLGRLGGPAAAPALVASLAQKSIPAGVASQAVLALGAPSLPFLRDIARSSTAHERAVVLELIGELGGAGDERLLLECLKDPSAEVRAAAARGLRNLAGPRAAAALRAALADRIVFVRLAAAEALGALGDLEAAPALIELARSEPNFDAAAAAARAAARIDPAAVTAAARDPQAAGPHLLEAADRLLARVPAAPAEVGP